MLVERGRDVISWCLNDEWNAYKAADILPDIVSCLRVINKINFLGTLRLTISSALQVINLW